MHTHRSASRGLQPPASREDWRAGKLSARSVGLRLLSSSSRSWLCGPLTKVGNVVEVAASPLQCTPKKNWGTGRVVSAPRSGCERLECSWTPWGQPIRPHPRAPRKVRPAGGPQGPAGCGDGRNFHCGLLLPGPAAAPVHEGRGPGGRSEAWLLEGGRGGSNKSYGRLGVESISTRGHLHLFSTFRRMTCPLPLREELLS